MDANELNFVIGISLVPVTLGAAAYVHLTARPSWESRFLALFLGFIAIRPISSLHFLFPDGSVLDTTFLAYEVDINYLGWIVFGAFGWLYPGRLRARSLHGALYLAGWALVTVGTVALLVARDTEPGVWLFTRAAEWLQTFILGVCISVTIRARALPAIERRAANALLPALALSAFTYNGSWTGTLLIGLVRDDVAIFTPATGVYTFLNFYGWMAAVWAYALFLAFRERVAMGLALLGVGFTMPFAGMLAPDMISVFPYAYLLRGLVTVHLGQRYGLLGMRPPRGAAAFVMPTLALGLVFLMVNTFVMSAMEGSDWAQPVGVLLGAGLGALAGLLVYPREGWGASRSFAPAAPSANGLLLDRYRVLRRLGEGGQGITQLCHDERLHRDVVVKSVRAESGESLREARALARVRHPNVVTVFDAEERGGDVHIVMEHVEAGSLRGRLARGAMGPPEAAHVVDQVLAGVEACHAAGIVHRDIKPENVLMGAGGATKLADFGLARDHAAHATLVGSIGTLAYMSPEQMRGEPADARTDVYAVGVLLAECLSGAPPVPVGADAFEVRARLRSRSGAGVAKAGGALADVVARATAPDARDRFATASAMRDALAEALGVGARLSPRVEHQDRGADERDEADAADDEPGEHGLTGAGRPSRPS